MAKRVLLIFALVVVLAVAAAGLAYVSGLLRMSATQSELEAEGALPATAAPQPAQQAEAPAAGATETDPGAADSAGADGRKPVAPSLKAPPPDPNSPFAKDIPGCYCHSKDPKLVKQHEAYRMNQCSGCHRDGVPTGQ